MNNEITIQVNGNVYLNDKNTRGLSNKTNEDKTSEVVSINKLISSTQIREQIVEDYKYKRLVENLYSQEGYGTLEDQYAMTINEYRQVITDNTFNLSDRPGSNYDIAKKKMLSVLDKDRKGLEQEYMSKDATTKSLLKTSIKYSVNYELSEQYKGNDPYKKTGYNVTTFDDINSKTNKMLENIEKNAIERQRKIANIKQKAITYGTRIGAGIGAIGLAAALNVGTVTGNQALQNKLNNGLDVASKGLIIAVNPAIGTANLALSTAISAIQMIDKIKNDEETSRLKLERLGMVI